MVEGIRNLKNRLIQYADKATQDMDHVDGRELGEIADMIKDLAEAEEECWKAAYYKAVVEAMRTEKSGYNTVGTVAGYGGVQPAWTTQAGMTMQQDPLESLRNALQSAGPDDRERLRNEAMQVIGRM